jgi:hypothetical protein
VADFTATVGGTVTPVGTIPHLTLGLAVTGSVGPAGVVPPPFLGVPDGGTVTPSGVVTVTIIDVAAGRVAPTGAVSASITGHNITDVESGTVSPTGAVVVSLSGIKVAGTVTPTGQVRVDSCANTLYELLVRLYERLDDPGPAAPVYYRKADAVHALNVANRLFVLLTLCIERTATFNLVNGQPFYRVADQITDFLVPLRVSSGGVRIRADRLHDLDGRDASWRNKAGSPERYAQAGFGEQGVLAVTKQPSVGVNTLTVTYAATPSALVNDSDTTEVPDEHQPALVDFAFLWCRLKEGGQELANAVEYLKKFLDDAQKYAQFVRAKSKGQLYDNVPYDLTSFDRSKFDLKLTKMKPQKLTARDLK